ncbi:MAG: hypothetical protein ACKO9H_02365 [Planctomycetota bacterium]
MSGKTTHHILLGMLVLSLAISSGCSSMLTARKTDLPLEENGPKNRYSIVVDSPYSRDDVKYGELKKGMTVQQALKEQGLVNKHRTSEITVMRPVPEKGEVIPMACEFQPGKPLIKFEQDYALHAGDRVVITPKKTAMEKMLDR